MSLGLSLRGRLYVENRQYDDQEIDQVIKEIDAKIEKLEEAGYEDAADQVREAKAYAYDQIKKLNLDSLDRMNGFTMVDLIASKFIEKLIG